MSFTYDRLAPCFRFVYTFACIALFLCCCRFSVNKDLYMRIVSLMDQRRGTNRPQASRTALAVITFSNYDLDAGRDSVVFAFKSARQRHRISSTIRPPTRNDGNRTRAAQGTLRFTYPWLLRHRVVIRSELLGPDLQNVLRFITRLS